MTATRHGTAVIEFPSELEVLITRKFEAPIQLVYDVLTTTALSMVAWAREHSPQLKADAAVARSKDRPACRRGA